MHNLKKTLALASALFLLSAASAALAAEMGGYTVHFDTNGGSHIAPLENVSGDSAIDRPPDPTRQGSVFLGWYAEAALINAWDFEQHRVSANLTLYAKWSNLHRIFMEDGGSGVTYAARGERVEIWADSSPLFYTFNRWVSSPSVAFGNNYSRRTYFVMPDRSVTIRATYRYTGIADGFSVGGCAAGSAKAAFLPLLFAAFAVLRSKKRRT